MQTADKAELSQVRCVAYEANGNLTNDGNGKTYTFDAANRMVSCTQTVNGIKTVTGYVYDGASHRVQETSNGSVVKQWVWCPGAWQPCEERDANNNVTKRFYGLGEQINGTAYFETVDHQGSTREMTNTSGSLVARYDYDPFGRRTLVSGTDLADFGFTGFYYDQATGLWLSRTRAYDPNLARWIGRDPLGERGGINLYAYVGNNPINAIDPLGLFSPSMLARGAKYALYEEGGGGGPEDPFADIAAVVTLAGFTFVALVIPGDTPQTQSQNPPGGPPGPPKKTCNANPPCFAAGTLVSTPHGEKKIEDLKAGDTVYAYDFKLGKTVERKVTAVSRHFTHHWVDVELGSETIKATRSHPFWVENEKRWVHAVDLKPGMLVHLESGRTAMVSEIIVHDLLQPETTYNLEVETDHDYFVGASQVLVHNAGLVICEPNGVRLCGLWLTR